MKTTMMTHITTTDFFQAVWCVILKLTSLKASDGLYKAPNAPQVINNWSGLRICNIFHWKNIIFESILGICRKFFHYKE